MEVANQTYSAVAEYWGSFVDQYGETEETETFLVVVVGWLFGFTTYCVYGGLLLLVDVFQKPKWLIDSRHQKSRPYRLEKTPYNPSFRQLMSNVMFNWFFVIFPGLYILQKVCKPLGLGVYLSRDLPTIKEIVLHSLIGNVFVDGTFFYSHWLLHSKYLYKRVHKVHHDFKAPNALAAIYAHPVEAAIGNTVAVMGPAFFLNLHVLEWWFGMVIGWMSTCSGHSGYQLPWWKKRSNGFSNFHDYHHEFFRGNYGGSGYFDWLHGTDKKWRVYCDKLKLEEKNKQE